MKKFKLLQSVLMLVLCMGVLTAGVLALNPISNSIAGTISVSSGKASLAITGYVDDVIVYPRTELHGGMDWKIASNKLNFDASNCFFPEQVPAKEIKLVIENLSNVPYGVFFCDTAGISATSNNIKTTGEVKSASNSSMTIANASMDYYKYISAADSSSTLDQAEMTITLSVANISTAAQSGSFTYYLNVEEYDPSLNTTEEFIKIDDGLTAIAESKYSGDTNIKNAIIPSTITSIGANAFNGCIGIEDISIPSSVTAIGVGAFANCTSLTEILIPSSVTSIGAGAFDDCISLQKIVVEAHSSSGNFGGTANLPVIDGMEWYIRDDATESQQSLSYNTTTIVYEIRKIKPASACGTINISGITAAAKNIAVTGYIGDEIVLNRTELALSGAGAILNIDKNKLSINTSGHTDPKAVPVKQIKLVVENLGNTALGVFFCNTLNVNATENNILTCAEIKSSNDSTKTIATSFLDFYKYVEASNTTNTFDRVEMVIDLELQSLTGIDKMETFTYNLNVEEYDPELNATSKFIKISNTQQAVDISYSGNTTVESIVIPTSVDKLFYQAFSGCTNLKNISLPESLTEVPMQAFSHTAITNITIPSSITMMGEYLFGECLSLKRATFLNQDIPSACFYGCTALEKVVMSDNVKIIAANAFEDCTSLKRVVMSESLRLLGDYAFYKCTSLIEVTLPESLETIGISAFEDCYGLKKLTILGETEINVYAFSYCTSLEEVIMSSVTAINESSFQYCTSLEEIIIPSSVNYIGCYVFEGCDNLIKITVEAHDTEGSFGDGDLPIIDGTAWFIGEGTVEQEYLSYSTDNWVFNRKDIV